MEKDFPSGWMWSEAFAVLARADRLHREIFRPSASAGRLPAWEPPVDILETPREVLVLVALPGVNAERVDVAIEGDYLTIAGTRILPRQLQTAVIHRLELPQGRFERRVRIPGGQYSDVRRIAVDGCLLITLQKGEVRRG